MRILIEGKDYPLDYLKDILDDKLNQDGTPKFYKINNFGDAKVITVGYYCNSKNEIVYMLPKVFRSLDEINKNDQKYLEPKIKHNDLQPWARKLIIHFHRGLEMYNKELGKSNSDLKSSKLKSKNGKVEYDYKDLVDTFIEFYLRNKNVILLRHIKHISNTVKKTNWERTVRKSIPIINTSKKPTYFELHNKKKVVNYEEELITIFLSIINNFSEEGYSDIKIDKAFNIAKGSQFKSLKRNGKSHLRKIKHRYYSDIMRRMFSLCEIYFKKNDTSKLSEWKPEFKVVNKYNTIFEAMLEKLVGEEDEKAKFGDVTLRELKNNRDGKIIDHIYAGFSIINNKDYIYFIADAKYYTPLNNEEEEEEDYDDKRARKAAEIHGVSEGSHSFYKQFTYAKNTIQKNVELFYHDDGKYKKIKIDKSNVTPVSYRDDEITEGYNITPNFFIYGYTDDKSLKDLMDPYITLNKTKESNNLQEIHQWPFRLFDRDTLFVVHYKISFPYVLKTYVSKNIEYLKNQKEIIRGKFRDLFIDMIKNHSDYKVYKIGFHRKTDIVDFVNTNFKILNGKCISVPFGIGQMTLLIAHHEMDEKFMNDFLIKIIFNRKSYLEKSRYDFDGDFKPHIYYTMKSSSFETFSNLKLAAEPKTKYKKIKKNIK